jgi:hypothetical protein
MVGAHIGGKGHILNRSREKERIGRARLEERKGLHENLPRGCT